MYLFNEVGSVSGVELCLCGVCVFGGGGVCGFVVCVYVMCMLSGFI